MQKRWYLSMIVMIMLVASITLLLSNSFGWFFGSSDGGDNTVTVGDFDLSVSVEGQTATTFDLGILTPTLITDVTVDRNTPDEKILEADKQFDEVAKCMSVTITNTGKIDFNISVTFFGATQGLHYIIVEKDAQQTSSYEKVKSYFTESGVANFPAEHSGFMNSLSGMRINAAETDEYELIVWLCYTCAGYPTKPPIAGVSQSIKMNISATQADGI